jgi:phosphoglycolate phosphatase-like HAD superfamily hydrolase
MDQRSPCTFPRAFRTSAVRRLAIFDIDGTLTDTNSVDDECYRDTVAEALGMTPSAIDWSGAAHVTDSAIFRWLCGVHGRAEPSVDEMSRTRSRFVERLTAVLTAVPTRFSPIAGARHMLERLGERGWAVAFATGGWGPSARLKLRVAQLAFDDAVFACADDATTRADIVQLALARAQSFYGRRFDRVVSVGDGAWDVETARALTLPFIGIAANNEHAKRLRAAGASIVLPDYSDLDAFWKALDVAKSPTPRSKAITPTTSVL